MQHILNYYVHTITALTHLESSKWLYMCNAPLENVFFLGVSYRWNTLGALSRCAAAQHACEERVHSAATLRHKNVPATFLHTCAYSHLGEGDTTYRHKKKTLSLPRLHIWGSNCHPLLELRASRHHHTSLGNTRYLNTLLTAYHHGLQ